MPRFPGMLLGLLLGALLVAHAVVLAFAGIADASGGSWAQNAVWLALSLGVAGTGRLFLALLPPGEPGAHDPRRLPATWATSLALGWLACAWLWQPFASLWAYLAERGSPAARWLPEALALGLLVGIAVLRWLTLPGALVPRHDVERSAGRERWILAGLLLLWLATAFVRRDFVGTLAWLALAILLEGGLARARRAWPGRAFFLLAFATLPGPGELGRGEWYGLLDALGVAAALGAGSAFLIPWLRRADRRAGVLAALFFGGVFLHGWDPLALVGPAVLVLASHRAQRGFALRVASGAAFAGAAIGLFSGAIPPARERLLLASELWRDALEPALYGLFWPLLIAALLLGALCFPWHAPAWSPGVIEPPRREALALAALLAAAAGALALPFSSWGEQEVLVILLPPAALLAGLLALPVERPAG